MKAISIKNPWATLIAQGEKTIEIRTWQTKYRGDILIVSSAKPDDFVKADFKRINEHGEVYTYYPDDPDNGGWCQYGKAIAVAKLVDITEFKPGHENKSLVNYSPGHYAWHLSNIREIEPFAVKGRLNIYEVEFKL